MEENTEKNTGNGNLRPPWKPGESGNPNGRPKGSGIRQLIRSIVEEPASTRRNKADWVARKLVHTAMKGNLGAIGMVIDNVDGKLSQPIEPLEVNFTFTTREEKEDEA